MKAFPARNTTEQGMDLRDYFAAKVLQSIISRNDFDEMTKEEIARMSYVMADTMMKARESK